MLVLKRKVGEVIKINDDIEVHVLDVEGDVIKLGFAAPKHVQIMRQELYEAIRNENLRAGTTLEESKQWLREFSKRMKP